MTIPTNSLTTFISSGLVFLLLGGFFGGEIVRKRQHKAEIKEILQKQQDILKQMELARQVALENEKKALNQIDSIYSILDVLAVREINARSSIGKVRDRINNNGKVMDKLKEELSKQSKESGFSFYPIQQTSQHR
ncbi:hypothetical protein [Haliscomenobacter hydrossis]|uniref:Uncharacterized protein n=1 Tax=Haliscomenobacter hydrossis (strain ATCC 27775 / DSM 1100 / LMG 10767 / O) TaxID=760192 RepID=F4L0G1_HALH1|nr:hypothetical protein [Haliscomenobacter hydrossis]AEE48473.1 hypothetical protein Halhy_0563 [Haliscomenobacter hydrossis DSM 1100]